MLSTSVKPAEITRKWFVVDADGLVLGRVASQIAKILQGKHQPYYSPQWDMGDHVIVINAEKIVLTGNKEKNKKYYKHTGFPGGIRMKTAGEMREDSPKEIITLAIKGMLPKSHLGVEMMKKLHVYVGAEHQHDGQQPEKLLLA